MKWDSNSWKVMLTTCHWKEKQARMPQSKEVVLNLPFCRLLSNWCIIVPSSMLKVLQGGPSTYLVRSLQNWGVNMKLSNSDQGWETVERKLHCQIGGKFSVLLKLKSQVTYFMMISTATSVTFVFRTCFQYWHMQKAFFLNYREFK